MANVSNVSKVTLNKRVILKRKRKFAGLTSARRIQLHFGTPEEIQTRRDRLEKQRLFDSARAIRRQRKKGLTVAERELVNIFREFGISYWSMLPSDAFKMVPKCLEGRKVSTLSQKALGFLQENFDSEQVEDPEGRVLIKFNSNKGEPTSMSLLADLATESGQPRKIVRAIYDALMTVVKSNLKAERAFRLPGLGKLRIAYKPAREKRKGINPFTKKPAIFKAKPASNRLRFRPFRELKDFVADLPVVNIKKKKKGKKTKKSKKNQD
jgi:nucleoid DNA-binding protein